METPPSDSLAPPSASPPGWAEISGSAPEPQPQPPRRPPREDGPPVRMPFALAACGLLIAAVALLLIGIPGGGGKGGGPLSPVAEAAEHTASVPGARFAGTGSGSFGTGSVQMSFEGAFNSVTGRSRMDMQIQSTSPPAVSTTMTGIQDGAVVYISSPLFAGQLPDGASWMKLDFSDLGDAAAMSAESTGAVDARQLLQELRSVAPGARVVGTERVRGVRTTRYAATIDPSLQAEQLREAGNDEAAALIEQGPPPTVGVWVDRKDLVRRMSMVLPIALPGQPAEQIEMTFDIFGFGATPAIEPPPSDGVFDATELGKQMLDAETG